MKTPLNELIKQMSYNRDRALGAEKDAYNICILYAENMLNKEKEVLMRAYQDGLDNGFANGNWDLNLWYNETFNTKEK